MREIKFKLFLRNKFVGYEKWYPGTWNEEGEYWKAIPRWMYSQGGERWFPDPDFRYDGRVQFTDLHDKNGKGIFEGDWFRSNSRVNPFIIVWHNGSFRGKYPQHDGEGFHIDEYETRYGEVIGNIYENPKLLEVS